VGYLEQQEVFYIADEFLDSFEPTTLDVIMSNSGELVVGRSAYSFHFEKFTKNGYKIHFRTQMKSRKLGVAKFGQKEYRRCQWRMRISQL
jgi:hypothetical protein